MNRDLTNKFENALFQRFIEPKVFYSANFEFQYKFWKPT